jgi:ribosomal protein S18 acetylase RimI-like enzyme
MISEVSLADESVLAEVFAVARAAYASEAALLWITDFPPLRETLADLCRCSDHFIVYRKDARIVGVLSCVCEGESVRITRLVVQPAHSRRGIASALLAEFEREFDSASRFIVSTASGNLPAIRLYERFGYAVTSATTSPEGIQLVHMAKDRKRSP